MDSRAHHFGLENLPFCLFGTPSRPGLRWQDSLVDLRALDPSIPSTLNELFAVDRVAALAIRAHVQDQLAAGKTLPLVPVGTQPLHLPFAIPNFVDFYSSRHHAENVGRLFRDPANPLPENWLHLPSGYNGRAGNVFVSGTPVQRPRGQYKDASGELVFAPTAQLDFELELGAFLCPGALDLLAGFVLLNDWSARDIQRWEYTPLGPFLSKAFATTVSPYLILPEAIAAFRCDGPPQDPKPLPHLSVPEPRAWDIHLQAKRIPGGILANSNYRDMYWSLGQQLAHLRSAGVLLHTGDLIGSGTVSGPDSQGSLLERGGPFLSDGDTVVLSGWAGDTVGDTVGFGDLTNTIHASPPL